MTADREGAIRARIFHGVPTAEDARWLQNALAAAREDLRMREEILQAVEFEREDLRRKLTMAEAFRQSAEREAAEAREELASVKARDMSPTSAEYETVEAELADARLFSIAQQEVIVAQKERERLLREALRERFVTERGGCRLCDDYWENPDTPSGLECACGMLALVAFDVAGEQPCATCTTHVSCQEDGRACER